MPDKPIWCGRLNEIIEELRALPFPWVDRATLERLLGLGRRRAQQILAPCVRLHVGPNGLAEREELIARLRKLASGESVYYERRRRERLAHMLRSLDETAKQQPRMLVEAPAKIVNQELAQLPEGVTLGPGEITVRFGTPVEALEKLLAIAMAAGGDLDGFERMVRQ
jgi:hypothetical protein